MLITIAAADFGEYRDSSRVPTEARLRANRAFKASDGTFILPGGDLNPDSYQRFAITMQGARMRVEAGTVYSTTDSDHSDASYSLDAFDADGNFVCNLLSRIRISNANNPTSWAVIAEFSKGSVQRNPSTYLDSNAILGMFNGIVNGALKGNSTQLGVMKLDVDPVDLNNPTAIGSNSPILNSIAAVGTMGRTQVDVVPADSAHPIAVGANSPRVSKDLALDYGNSFATAITDIGSSSAKLAVTAPITESADRTIPANIQLDIKPEGLITIASGKTFTIGSMIDPGNRQVFAGAGAVRFVKGAVERYNTTWWTGPTSGAVIDKALTDIFASTTAAGGGRVIVPNGTWLCAGNQTIPTGTILEGSSRRGLPDFSTEIRLTSGTRPLFKTLPGVGEIRLRSLTLNGNSQAACQGLLVEGTSPGDAIATGIYIENCTVMNFTDGIYLHGINDWQIRQVFVDRSCVLANNSQSGIRVATVNSNVFAACDFFIPNGASGIWAESIGGLMVQNSEFGFFGTPGYGTEQVEQQIVAGNVTVAGMGKSVVNGVPGSPLTVNVPLTTAENTAGKIADKFRRALAKDATIAAYCHILGSNGDSTIQLAKIDPAANDGTFNFTIETGTATGVTNNTTSTNLVAGVATTQMAEAAINVTGPYGFIGLYNTQDEGCKYTVKHNYANFSAGNCLINNSLVLGRVGMLQPGRVTLTGVIGQPKFLRDAAAGSGSIVTANGCCAGPNAFIGGAFRASEQRIHNFSDIAGISASVISETNSGNAFTFTSSVSQARTRFTQPSAAWFVDPLDPWVAILGKLADQRLLRLGRADASGYGDFYYDFWRETATGFLHLDGNQADPFKALVVNCPIFTVDDPYGVGWNGLTSLPTKNAVYDEMENRATKASPVFTGRVLKSTTTTITPGATPTLNAALGDIFTLVPGEDETISITNQAANQDITLRIFTSGTTSRAITFGSGFKPSAVLNTGTVDAKYFIVKFWSDGTRCFEINRTAAL